MAAQPLTFHVNTRPEGARSGRRNQRQTRGKGNFSRNYKSAEQKKTIGDVMTLRVDRRTTSKGKPTWQKRHTQNTRPSPHIQSGGGRFAALADDSDEEQPVIESQRFPSISSKPLGNPLPYGKMIRRTTKVEAPPPLVLRTPTVSVPQPKPVTAATKPTKRVSFAETAKSEAPKKPAEQDVFEFQIVDFTDDWADMVEAEQSSSNTATPDWAMSEEEKATKQRESISSLQDEMATGWDD